MEAPLKVIIFKLIQYTISNLALFIGQLSPYSLEARRGEKLYFYISTSTISKPEESQAVRQSVRTFAPYFILIN